MPRRLLPGSPVRVLHRIVTAHSLRQSEQRLRSARSVFYRLAKQRADFATDQCRLITELPIFRASLSLGDPPTITAMADGYRRRLRAQFCIVTDADSRWLGDPGWPGGLGVPPALAAAIRQAAAGKPWSGYLTLDRKLFLVVCEPAHFGEEVLGTMTAAYSLDDTAAWELARLTGCEVSFAFRGLLRGSSLRRSGKAALGHLLADPADSGLDQQDAPGWYMYRRPPWEGTSDTRPGYYAQFRHHVERTRDIRDTQFNITRQLSIEGLCNFAFLDGHAKALKPGQAFASANTEDGVTLSGGERYLLWNRI